jgi:hypothetical protein
MLISKLLVRALSCALLIPTAAIAQNFQAQITGVVRDPTGSVVPEAQITAANNETGASYQTRSNGDGNYSLPALLPGTYKVTCSHPGFKRLDRAAITVEVSQELRLDFQLEPGNVSEEITVTAAAPELEESTATVGQIVTTREIDNLPLNVRDTFALIGLTPGVVFGASFGNAGTSPDVGRNFFKSDFYAGGGRSGSQEILIDGAPDTTPDVGRGLINPPPDSVREFKVQLSIYDAQFGRSSGGTLNMVTKSGTNELHGVLYDYDRHSIWDANNFFANLRALPVSSFQRHQFGANAGAAAIKNKWFFFGDYEGLRQGYPVTSVSTAPTPLQRTGDFSKTMTPDGALIVVYDPATLTTQSNGNRTRTAFPGNVIPASRFDKVAANSVQYFPLPNLPGDPVTNQNNYVYSQNSTTDGNKYDIRSDYNITDNTRMFVRLSREQDIRFGAGNMPLPAGGGRNTTDHYTQAVADVTRVFSANVVADLQYSVVRGLAIQAGASRGFDNGSLGFAPNVIAATDRQFPLYNISDTISTDYIAVENDAILQAQPRNVYTARGSINWLRGRHNLKFGAESRVLDFNEGQWNDVTGNYSFSRTFTQGPIATNTSRNAGYGWASFLLGNVSGGDIQEMEPISTRGLYSGFFIQDDWRVTERLTLNLGLRYDITIGDREKYNRLAYLDLNATSPLAAAAGLPNLKGQLDWIGQGNTIDQQNTGWKNLGPRIGFAYRIGSKTVMRGGYGIAYVPKTVQGNGDGAIESFRTTPLTASTDSVTPLVTLSNPFPSGILPVLNDRNPLANIGASIVAPTLDFKSAYVQTWSFGFQRQLPWNLLITTNYWGNKGTHLITGPWNLNQLPDVYLQLQGHLSDQVPNPFYGLINQTAYSSPTISRQQTLYPYPQYAGASGVQEVYVPAGNSTYHGASFTAERRLSSSLTLLASFTVSKVLDDLGTPPDVYNRSWWRAVSAFDTPRQFQLSWVYHLPFGHGRQFGAAWRGVTDAVLGGWNLSSIVRFQRGLPVSISTGVNDGQSGVIDNPTLARWFNTSVFSAAKTYTFGNLGPRSPDIRADGVHNIDAVLAKSFFATVKDRQYEMQFRGEFFNVMNTPQFGAPNGSVTSQSFGTVTSQTNNPREIQLGLKIKF